MDNQFNINDLKDLDVEKLTKILIENQIILIKIALVLGTLFMVVMMFNDHRTKEQNLRTSIAKAQEKLDAIKARDAAIGDLNKFKSSMSNDLNEFQLIGLISDYAKSHNINIPSLSPGASKDMGLYDVIVVNFNAVSDNFKDMMFFLRNVEKSNYPLRIDSWSGHEDSNGNIIFNIQISAVLIHT